MIPGNYWNLGKEAQASHSYERRMEEPEAWNQFGKRRDLQGILGRTTWRGTKDLEMKQLYLCSQEPEPGDITC